MKQFTREIRTTEDGSKTIYIPEIDENYHSMHGALQEASHVFISNGFNTISLDTFSILEIGFGTGLNALLTYIEAVKKNKTIHYTGLEAYPVDSSTLQAMDYTANIDYPETQHFFQAIHQVDFGKEAHLSNNFTIKKIEEKLENFIPEDNQFDLIYYDAFGPRAQADMWQVAHFEKLYKSLQPNGILVTYCAKGQVKRDLKSVGFTVEALPGPPGKREMTRCIKTV